MNRDMHEEEDRDHNEEEEGAMDDPDDDLIDCIKKNEREARATDEKDSMQARYSI